MSVCAHALIGPRRHVTADLKKGRFLSPHFPWGTFLNISPLYHFSVLKKGGDCFADFIKNKKLNSPFLL
jgi:hypothetical protein